jgi:membrane protein YqaA with SNARE-associated domain
MNPFKWIRKLYDQTLELSKHPKSGRWLAIVSFAESSFFPIPPDVMLLPMCMANRDKAVRLALICTIASVLGGLFGYAIGYFAFDTIGRAIIEFYGAGEKYEQLQNWYDEQGALVVFLAGFTPIPYKVITVSAGVFQFNLLSFMILSFASRGARFLMVALAIKFFGEPAMKIIDKHFDLLTIVGGILLVGGFIVLKFMI